MGKILHDKLQSVVKILLKVVKIPNDWSSLQSQEGSLSHDFLKSRDDSEDWILLQLDKTGSEKILRVCRTILHDKHCQLLL